MPRVPAKRKIPTADDGASDNDNDNDNVNVNATKVPAHKKPAKASRKAAAAKWSTRRGGSEISTRLSASASIPKKRLTIANDFRKQIQKQGDDLVNFIDQQLRTHSVVFDKKTVDEELTPSLAHALPWLTSPTSSSQTSVYPPQLTLKALDELYEIIEGYERLNIQGTSIKKPIWMRWEQDGKELTELNEYAMSFAARNVNLTVMPGLHGSVAEPPIGACDIQKMAWELMDDGRPNKGEETWGGVAQGQMKAFTSLLRTLPSEK